MSDPKHTPLPWRVGGDRLGGIEITDCHTLDLDPGERTVAVVYCRGSGDGGHCEEEANAALIVRAVNHHHALLAAAEQVLTLFNPAGRDLPIVALLREAVEKAKG